MARIIVHSSKGYVIASPMACVDLEKSIPEETKPFVINADDTATAPVNEDNKENEGEECPF